MFDHTYEVSTVFMIMATVAFLYITSDLFSQFLKEKGFRVALSLVFAAAWNYWFVTALMITINGWGG